MLSPHELLDLRSQFPYFSQGRLYLNHAGTGPLSTPVISAIRGYLERHSSGEIDTYHSDVAMLDETRQRVARLINAESPRRVAFVTNTSEAINIVASGIEWKSNDRILLPTVEFPANVHPYLNQKTFGANVDLFEVPGGCITAEDVQSRLTPNTRLVALSAIQFLSGYRADLEAIGSLCRERDVIFAVDGIQAVGAVNIDVQRMKIDCLAAGAQKWQLSPQGTGFFYVTEDLQMRIHQRSLGWLAMSDPWKFYDFNQPIASSARRYEGGSLNMQGLWGMHTALTVHLQTGMNRIEPHLLHITGHLIERLQKIKGVSLVTPDEEAKRGGIVTIALDGSIDPRTIFKGLLRKRVTIALREGLLRFSPHFYNTVDDMDRAADATEETLKEQLK
jgi:cysteine desulfurase/selenocysteine lyase